MTDTVIVSDDRSAECKRCGHFAAYHEDPSRPCYAWDPDASDHKCRCPGWEEKLRPEPLPVKMQEIAADAAAEDERLEDMRW